MLSRFKSVRALVVYILLIVTTFLVLAGSVAAEPSDPNQSSRYLDAFREGRHT